jgi:hypothetical protein
MRQVPEETSGCAREGMRQKPDESGETEEDGQEEMRVTTAGEKRLMVYGSKSVLFAALPLSVVLRRKQQRIQEVTFKSEHRGNSCRRKHPAEMPPWSLRQKIALTCRILAAEGHESALAGQITARGSARHILDAQLRTRPRRRS